LNLFIISVNFYANKSSNTIFNIAIKIKKIIVFIDLFTIHLKIYFIFNNIDFKIITICIIFTLFSL